MKELQAIGEEGHRRNRIVVAHCRTNNAMRMVVDPGFDAIMQAWFTDDSGVKVYDEALADHIASHGVRVNPTLQITRSRFFLYEEQLQRGELPEADAAQYARMQANHAETLDHCGRLFKAGVKLMAGSDCGWERMNRMHISNYLGFAFEYMVGMASLTLGGVLNQFSDLKLCFFEVGGAWLPWLMYTLDRVHHVEPQCSRVPNPPSEYIKRSCMVAVEPDEWCLPQAIASIGSENFIIGSDYPHPPSTYPNTAAGLENMEGLTPAQKEKILERNLMPWMKFSCSGYFLSNGTPEVRASAHSGAFSMSGRLIGADGSTRLCRDSSHQPTECHWPNLCPTSWYVPTWVKPIASWIPTLAVFGSVTPA
jgi:hypothetical protein